MKKKLLINIKFHKYIYPFGSLLYCSCFLYNENKISILICCFGEPNEIKILELDGEISNFPNTKLSTTFIDNFRDLNSNTTYVVTCHKEFMRSYIYNTKTLYKEYKDSNNNIIIDNKIIFEEILIHNDDNDVMLKLISSDSTGYIKVWNFHSGQLLNKINCFRNKSISLSLWNSRYLIGSSVNFFLAIIDLRENKIINALHQFKNLGDNIVEVKLPNYGKCIIGRNNNYINLIHC